MLYPYAGDPLACAGRFLGHEQRWALVPSDIVLFSVNEMDYFIKLINLSDNFSHVLEVPLVTPLLCAVPRDPAPVGVVRLPNVEDVADLNRALPYFRLSVAFSVAIP
jgi:hypothetical protein